MKRFPTLFLLYALILLALVPAVFAKTITIDGDGSEWEAVEIIASDADDIFSANLDLFNVYFTNNSNTAFFRVDLDAGLATGASLSDSILICLDSDNDAATGDQTPNYCPAGTDYTIQVRAGGDQELSDCTSGTCNWIEFPGILDHALGGALLELAVGTADIGLDSSTTTIPVTVITLAGAEEPTDATSGIALIPGPTAISTARAAATAPALPWAAPAALLLLTLLAAAVTARRRR